MIFFLHVFIIFLVFFSTVLTSFLLWLFLFSDGITCLLYTSVVALSLLLLLLQRFQQFEEKLHYLQFNSFVALFIFFYIFIFLLWIIAATNLVCKLQFSANYLALLCSAPTDIVRISFASCILLQECTFYFSRLPHSHPTMYMCCKLIVQSNLVSYHAYK